MMCRQLFSLLMLVSVLCLTVNIGLAQEVELINVNGDFETGDTAGWELEGVEVEVISQGAFEGNNCMHVFNLNQGNPWAAQARALAGYTFEEGKQYTFACFLKTEPGQTRSVSMRFQEHGTWAVFPAESKTITDEWDEYYITSPVLDRDYTPGRAGWEFGDSPGEIWFDAAAVYLGEYIPYNDRLDPTYQASNPNPYNGQTDVVLETELSWDTDANAVSHDIYFGTDFVDVNEASTTSAAFVGNQTDVSMAPPVDLELGKTYYWRVDEVLDFDGVVSKGVTWSFEVEPVAYQLSGVVATGSSYATETQMADKAVDGSGLDPNDEHSTNMDDMWLSDGTDEASIEFALGQVYKLDRMNVWNHNSQSEGTLGYGIKEALIEVSVDGTTWTELKTVELAQAPGVVYAGESIALDGVLAQGVRITAKSNYSLINLPNAGLSEVAFYSIPTYAREPHPESGKPVDGLDVVLGWRAGRGAVSHEVYLGMDDAFELIATVDVPELDLSGQDLQLGQTYQWKIVEVDGDSSSWESAVWTFTTPENIIIDDFEDYSNEYSAMETIYQTWIDGIGYEEPEPGQEGNDSGALAGHDIWSTYFPDGSLNPHYDGTISEGTIVHGGTQSGPMYFDAMSEMTRSFTPTQNWNRGGLKTLSIYFHGDPGNTAGQLYVKVNGVKVNYDGDSLNVAKAGWNFFNVELSAFAGAALDAVSTLTIGLASGSGVVYLDDIRLYSRERQFLNPVDPGTDGLKGYFSLENGGVDDSGNGNDATIVGDPVVIAGPAGMGNALEFDGTGSQYADLGAWNPSAETNQLSVGLWVKWNGLTNAWQGLIGKRTSWGEDTMMWQLEAHQSTGVVRAGRNSGATVESVGLTEGAWEHWAFTTDGVTGTVYRNGLVVGSGNFSFGPGTDASLLFGCCESAGGNPFNGAQDEVKIYDRVLTQEEVAGMAGFTEPVEIDL